MYSRVKYRRSKSKSKCVVFQPRAWKDQKEYGGTREMREGGLNKIIMPSDQAGTS